MAAFPSWTRLFFKNATAPVGWTKDVSETYDHGLRIVSGYLGTSIVSVNDSAPWSSTMTNSTFPISVGTISPGSTNPAVQDVPPHTHSTNANWWSPTTTPFTTLAYFNATGNSTFAAQLPSALAPNSGLPSITGNGVHLHTITYSQTFTSSANNTNLNVKYTDLILAYKTPTGSKTYTVYLDGNKTSFNEGDTFSIYVDTSMNVPLGKQFIYNIIPVTAFTDDFNLFNGTFTTTVDSGTFRRGNSVNITTSIKYYTTGSRYFKYEIIDPIIGSTVFLSTPIEIKDYYSEWVVSPDNTALTNGVNEGSTLTLNYILSSGSSLTGYWRIKFGGTGGVLSNAADFVGTISGSVGPKALTTDTNTYPINIQITSDYLTEGVENFAIECSDTSNFAIIRFTSPNYKINDTTTGTGGTVAFTSAPTSVNEGASGSFSISTGIFPSGYTGLYWTINHTTTSVADFVATSGLITLSGTTGSFTVSPIADLTTEGAETFTVSIRNGGIIGPILATSGAVTVNDTSISPVQVQFTTSGTYTWTVPLGVTSICVLCVGAGGNGGLADGGGGGGGALVYVNNVSVTPGTTYSLQVGQGGGTTGNTGTGASWFNTPSYLYANGGASGTTGTGGTGGGGGGAAGYSSGSGGRGGYGNTSTIYGGNGGLAGGTATGVVAGQGGTGGYGISGRVQSFPATLAQGGSGGGAGGSAGYTGEKGGGGVGILGQSSVDSNGATTFAGTATAAGGSGAYTTNGGSGGTSATDGAGGTYGGGAGANSSVAGGGAVRIIWGAGRAFPSTNTGNL